jgi:hypothetical protein
MGSISWARMSNYDICGGGDFIMMTLEGLSLDGLS